MNWILTFAILTVKLVSSKALDINQVLRIQMEKLVHRYEVQKNTQGHQLKDKVELDSIKRDLKVDFQKAKNKLIRKLHRQQAQNRRKLTKTELVRTKRSIIDEAIGLDVNKVLRSQMENLIKEYNMRKMTEGHVYESLRDENSLKLLKNELKNSFRKTVISTGQKLSERKSKNDNSPKTATEGNGNTAPIRRRRLERLQKHYGTNFETPKNEWSRHFGHFGIKSMQSLLIAPINGISKGE